MMDQHEPGAKLDKGKLQPTTVLAHMRRAITAVCEVGTVGAEKYSHGGFLKVPDGYNRYTDAMFRHFLLEEEEEFDSDLLDNYGKRIRHQAQVAWNALARLELMLRDLDKPIKKLTLEEEEAHHGRLEKALKIWQEEHANAN